MTGTAARRALAALAVAAAVGLAGASPASADPPQPTEFRAVVESVEPAAAGVEASVLGGDAFLQLRVDRGREVTVHGYQDEPYLRFLDDGTVQRNRNSPATYVNEDRMGGAAVPPSAGPEAEPAWEDVADGGTYAWHDHNIHWMADGDPPGHEPGDVVQPWSVRLTVDGTPTTVSGRLEWVRSVSPLPWAALGLVAAAAVLVADRRGAGRGAGRGARREGLAGPLGPVAALVGAGVATVVGWAEVADAPAGSGATALPVLVPAVGVAAGAAGLALRRRAPAWARAASLAAVAAVGGWAVLRLDVLWKPILPTLLPAGLDRAGTALALGLAVAAAAAVVLGSGLVGPIPGSDVVENDEDEKDENGADDGAEAGAPPSH